MDRKCCVGGCDKTREEDNVVLHKFPNPEKEPIRFRTWTFSIGGDIMSLDHDYVFKYRKVCHEHFEQKYKTWTKMLIRNAVPTLYLKENYNYTKEGSIKQEMAAIDDEDVIEYKNEADHLWAEETHFKSCDNSEVNIKSEVDDKPIDYNINEEANLKETVEIVNNIRIKKESSEGVNYIEFPQDFVKNDNGTEITEKSVKILNDIECRYNLPGDYGDKLVKIEVDDKLIDYNINEEANLKETVEIVNSIRIKKESSEDVNYIEFPQDFVKNDNGTEITEKSVKILNDIECRYNLPGDYGDKLVKIEVDDKLIDYNVNEEANLKETVENVNSIRIKKESSEDVNYIEFPQYCVKNDKRTEITEKTVKNLNDIEYRYNLPGEYGDKLVKIEVDDKLINSSINEEANLKETVENVNSIRIKKESSEDINYIEFPQDFVKNDNGTEITEKSVKNLNDIECRYNLPGDYGDKLIKIEVDDKLINYNINEEANLKETVENVNSIRIKKESSEDVNYIEFQQYCVKNDKRTEITDKTVKNLNDFEYRFNLPGDCGDELQSEIPNPEGSLHCERRDLSFASQENHKIWCAKHADERTVKIIPRLAQPVVVNGVQFAKSPRVELRKYNAPPEYAGMFGAPLKKPKADSLKVKHIRKASNEESVKTVNSDANISELFEKPGHLEEAEDVADHTETVVDVKNKSLIEAYKDKFICNNCGRQFHKKHSIILHLKTHLKDVYNQFEKCENLSVTKDSLKKHSKLSYENRKYFCDVCNSRFTSEIILKQHEQKCDRKNNISNTHSTVKPYACEKCGKKFNLKHDFIRHMKTHTGEKAYSCTVCNKQFSRSDSLIAHMRTHTLEKPHSCTVCNKKFSVNGNLIIHMRTHTGEKPYSCTVCNKKFSVNSSLNKHMRTHTGERPHTCTVCNKKFSQSYNLNYHMRTHTGEKPYSCKLCNNKFRQSNILIAHMRTHTGEKPYSCTVCNKTYSISSSLIVHMRSHTGEKPYSCKLCKYKFSQSYSLNKHMKTHTNV